MSEKKQKYYFIFPPLTLNQSPIIGIPELIGILEKNGIDSQMVELNSKFHEHCLNREFFRKYKEFLDKIYNQNEIFQYSEELQGYIKKYKRNFEQVSKFADYYGEEIEFAKEILKSPKLFYKPVLSQYALTIIGSVGNFYLYFANQMLKEFFANLLKFYDTGKMTDFEIPFGRIKDFLMSDLFIFKDFLMKEAEEICAKNPDCVGVSINVNSQLFAGLAICLYIKQINKNIHVSIGGSFFSTFYTNILNLSEIFEEFADSIIYGTGDSTSVKLMEALRGQADFSEVPNLLFSRDNRLVVTPRDNGIKLTEYPPESFSGYKMEEYDIPEIVLPVRTSVACYWGKCKYCISKRDRNFQIKTPKQMFDEIKLLSEKYNTKYFYFWDNSMSPHFFGEFADLLIKNKLKIKYSCYARFEKQFTYELLKKIKKSGCMKISWGLDSGSEEMLKYINKGITLPVSEEVLKYSAKAGIINQIYLIFGYPTENDGHLEQSYNFVEQNKKYIDNIIISHKVLYFKGSSFYESDRNNCLPDTEVTGSGCDIINKKIEKLYRINSKFYQELGTYNLLYFNKFNKAMLNLYSLFFSLDFGLSRYIGKRIIEHYKNRFKRERRANDQYYYHI